MLNSEVIKAPSDGHRMVWAESTNFAFLWTENFVRDSSYKSCRLGLY